VEEKTNTNIIEKLISLLNYLINYLESIRAISEIAKDDNENPIISLAPKVLKDEAELKKIQPYLDNLKGALETKGVNNIAITGGYGSGKSTMLKTFECLNKEKFNFLKISLASFNVPEDLGAKVGETNIQNELEVSILQQMFYHVKPSEIPDSRFKRIKNITKQRIIFYIISFLLWLYSILLLVHFNYVETLNPQNWTFSNKFSLTGLFSCLIFLIGTGVLVQKLYRLFKNSRINKVSIKGELELGDKADASVFNKYLEEILYFFERTTFNVVIIEDLDRFDNTDIFTKLREINFLINNSNLIERQVKFVYAIKDEMFDCKNDRVKFFEFIIPIVPFINTSNANDQLTQLIINASLQKVLSKDFTDDIVSFIDDIDMRLLINIFQEYQIYSKIINSNLDQDKLFAMIIYKNVYPKDFGELQQKQGDLYSIFNKKKEFVANLIPQYQDKIEEKENQINKIESEVDKPIKELRAVYINKLVSKLPNFVSFDIKGVSNIDDVLVDEYFQLVKQNNRIKYKEYFTNYNLNGLRSKMLEVTFQQIEREVSEISYDEREKNIIQKTDGTINRLKQEIAELKLQIQNLKDLSLEEIFTDSNNEEYLGVFKENNLIRYLLTNGYIDENYYDYISIFHEVDLTKEDFTFVNNVKNNNKLAIDYELKNLKPIVKKIAVKHFKKDSILNLQLVEYLINNEIKNKDKYDNLFEVLKIDNEAQFNFITRYIAYAPKNLNKFINKLCKVKPSLWRYSQEKAKLPLEQTENLLLLIFEYAELKDIVKLEGIEDLKYFISGMPNFFEFSNALNNTLNLEATIKKYRISITALDQPDKKTPKLYKTIYEGSFYNASYENIDIILAYSGVKYDTKKLRNAYYTEVKKTELEHLIALIDENFVDLIIDKHGNNGEDEQVIIEVLNNNELDRSFKELFINQQKNVIKDLSTINKLDDKSLLLMHNKTEVSWSNLNHYYEESFDAMEPLVLDEYLLDFLNSEKNFKILSKLELEFEPLQNAIIYNNITIEAFKALLNSLPRQLDSIENTTLSDEKIIALIEADKLNYTEDILDVIKTKNNQILLKFIQQYQEEFLRDYTLYWESQIYIDVLQSSKIKQNVKEELIEKLSSSKINNDPTYLDVVSKTIPLNRVLEIESIFLYNLIKNESDVNHKINLINAYSSTFEGSDLINLTKLIDPLYAEIFDREKETFLPNEKNVKELLDNLVQLNLIKEHKLDKKLKLIKVIKNEVEEE